MSTAVKMNWPRTKDLPEPERSLFENWLLGQTRPLIKGEPDYAQDGYYQHDYERWKEQNMELKQRRADWD